MKLRPLYILIFLGGAGLWWFMALASEAPSESLDVSPNTAGDAKDEWAVPRRASGEMMARRESVQDLVEGLANQDSDLVLIAHLKGRVQVVDDGAKVAGAEIIATRLEGDDAPGEILARGRSEAEGQFSIALPRFLAPYRVALRAEHPSFVSGGSRHLEIAALGAASKDGFSGNDEELAAAEEEILLELVEGGLIGGRVLDVSGADLAGVALIATSARVALSSTSIFKTGATLALARREAGDENQHVVVSDLKGEFLFRGLNPEFDYAILARDFEYLVTPPQRHAVGERDLSLVVEASRSLIGEIVDAETGEALPRALLQLRIRSESGATSRAGTCIGGRVEFAWSRWAPGKIEISAQVSAAGYERLRQDLVIPAHENQGLMRFELRAIAGARIPLRVVDCRGVPLRGPLRVSYRERGGGRRGVVKDPALGDRGERRISLPAGRWEIRVAPDHFAASLAASDWQRIETSRAVVAGVDVVLENAGGLGIDLGNRSDLPVSILCVGEGFVGSVALEHALTFFEAFPAGRWRLRGPAGPAKTPSESEVLVVPGSRQQVTIPW